jgi:hypothetical protein
VSREGHRAHSVCAWKSFWSWLAPPLFSELTFEEMFSHHCMLHCSWGIDESSVWNFCFFFFECGRCTHTVWECVWTTSTQWAYPWLERAKCKLSLQSFCLILPAVAL